MNEECLGASGVEVDLHMQIWTVHPQISLGDISREPLIYERWSKNWFVSYTFCYFFSHVHLYITFYNFLKRNFFKNWHTLPKTDIFSVIKASLRIFPWYGKVFKIGIIFLLILLNNIHYFFKIYIIPNPT